MLLPSSTVGHEELFAMPLLNIVHAAVFDDVETMTDT